MIRDWWEKYHTIITRLMDWFGIGGKTSHHYHRIDWWTGHGCIRKGVVEVRFMGWIDTEHQATQPAVLSTGCKRCRATAKKNNEQKAKELEAKATETSSSELIVALSALPRAEEAPVPPPQSLNELMNHTLKRLPWRMCGWRYVANDILYQACPFHPTTSSIVSTPRLNLEVWGTSVRKRVVPCICSKLEKLKEDSHPQVWAKLQQGSLKCKCE